MSRAPRAHLLRLAAIALTLSIALAAGCKHDLDKLSSKYDKLRAGSGGKAGGSSGKGGSSGRGGSGSGGDGNDGGLAGTGGSKPVDAGLNCEPCEELSDAAKTLGMRTCCRGVLLDECGLTFGEGTLCLPRMVPGQDNSLCGEVRVAGMRLAGCCRPDGRCGVVAHGVGLGCIAREELAPALAPGATAPGAVACEFTCTDDAECQGPIRDRQCGVSLDQTRRFCAPICERDGDCPSGQLCSLTADVEMKRVQALCTEPVGDAEPGEVCTRTNDCAHNICGMIDGEPNFCSQLCKGPNDCRPGYKSCEESNYGPSGDGKPQKFFVCQPPP